MVIVRGAATVANTGSENLLCGCGIIPHGHDKARHEKQQSTRVRINLGLTVPRQDRPLPFFV